MDGASEKAILAADKWLTWPDARNRLALAFDAYAAAAVAAERTRCLSWAGSSASTELRVLEMIASGTEPAFYLNAAPAAG